MESVSQKLFSVPTLNFQIECVELVDDVFVSAINKFSDHQYPVSDSLWIKLQGPNAKFLQESAKIVNEVVKKHGATHFQLAKNPQDAHDLWEDRKNAHYYGLQMRQGAKGWPTDVWHVIR